MGYILWLSEMSGKEDQKPQMPQPIKVEFEDSIAHALGVLYERKARGAALIRVLEDYRRARDTPRPSFRHRKPGLEAPSPVPQRQLAELYERRAAVDQVIRSIEAYSHCQHNSA